MLPALQGASEDARRNKRRAHRCQRNAAEMRLPSTQAYLSSSFFFPSHFFPGLTPTPFQFSPLASPIPKQHLCSLDFQFSALEFLFKDYYILLLLICKLGLCVLCPSPILRILSYEPPAIGLSHSCTRSPSTTCCNSLPFTSCQ